MIAVSVLLFLCVCYAIVRTRTVSEPVVLNVSLYKSIPDYDSFEKTVGQCWKEIHPEAELNFVDWDCYSGTVPDDLDVFVLDTLSLDAFAEKDYLLALSEEEIQDYDDLIPSFVEGCRVDGEICAIPQLLCTDLLYTRKDDAGLKNVKSIHELYETLGSSGLLLDKQSAGLGICMYMQAQIDGTQQYTDHYPPIEEDTLDQEAIASLEEIRNMHQTDPEGIPEDSGWFPYARKFAEGMGDAYIGFSESMDVMEEGASEMDFRLFSMTDDKDIPVFYVDAAAVNAKISDEKRALAIDFLNMITGKDLLARASAKDGDPRYLLTPRYSVYDMLEPDYPIYADLKTVASVPDAFVFRISPDGDKYLDTAEQSADLLPSLSD